MDEYIETVEIKDDFDMEKIRTCGQAFRIRCMSDGGYLFVTGENVLSIRKKEDGIYDISCDLNEWKDVWIPYFDLERDYRAIREKNSGKYPYVDRAMDYGKGLRILRQDSFEMLITFIISQRKNIPAISGAVENLCVRFGRKVERCGRNIHLFPQPKELVSASKEDLNALGMGYRSSYIMDALGKVISGELDIEKISHLRDDELFCALKSVKGVGDKVSNCVCLFGYGRVAMAPVDVWIKRVIDEEFEGIFPFGEFGDVAGIIQQYLFFYIRENDR